MNEWWTTLDTFEKIFWVIAIPSTLAFLIQLVLTFFGADMDMDADADMEVDAEIEADHGIPFQFFTLKNLIAFFTVFGWTGIACLDAGLGQGVSVVVAFISGLLMMTVMATIFYYMGKLTDSGSLNMLNALNTEGEVYLIIPKSRSGFGKVQIKIQGSLRELDAATNDLEDIPTGSIVRVTEVSANNILIVTKSS
ncbi:hypothetical protein GYB22_01140 [bacterium]|nr:hypothetical protein [bacterium]